MIIHHVKWTNILASNTIKSSILLIDRSLTDQISNYLWHKAKWSCKFTWVCISTENVLPIE
jgi:hypothetical protein